VQTRLRFYLNNGPVSNGRNSPGTMFYDSGWFAGISPTPRSIFLFTAGSDLPAGGLFLPASNLTWSVQFQGLGATDSAGVDLYSPPITGTSASDYWENSGGNWTLKTNALGPMNFATRFVATTSNNNPAVIIFQPTNQSLLIGQSAVLQVAANGSAPLTYQWQFNGVNLTDTATRTGSQSNTLVIGNLQAGDAGNYHVIVSNSLSAVTSSNATLLVSPPPFFDEISLQNDGSVRLACVLPTGQTSFLEAAATLAGPWTSIGSFLFGPVVVIVPTTAPARYFRIFVPALGVYSTNQVGYVNVSAQPGANEVYNPFSGVTLAGAMPSPPDLTEALILSQSGAYLDYYYDATAPGWWDATFSFPAGATIIPAATNFFVYPDQAFQFTLAGVVAQVASNQPPSITQQPANRTAAPGSTAAFGVVAAGSPPLYFQWRLNGLNLADNAHLSGTKSTNLTVLNVSTNDAGNYQVVVTNAFGAITSAVATLTLGKLTPQVVWTNPAAISYGIPLGTNQLNATADVPGAFVYTPGLGTFLTAGTNTLSTIFTPSDPVTFNSMTGSVNLLVLRAPLTVTANNAQRAYGETNPGFSGTISGLTNSDIITASYACSATTNSLPGVYPIVPTLVDVSNRLGNYSVTTNNGALAIAKIAPVLTWTNPAAITYATSLSATQLNASASSPGTFAYTPPVGTFLNSGTNNLGVLFTPSDPIRYNTATSSVIVVVTRAPLSVTANDAIRAFGTTNPIFGGIITGLRGGDNITATYAGSATTNSPPGNYVIVPSLVDPSNRLGNYLLATTNGTLTVVKATPVITWNPPAAIPYGTGLGGAQLNASANVAGVLAYAPVSGTVLNAGTNSIFVTLTPTNPANYNGASASIQIVVLPAGLTVTANSTNRGEGQADPAFTGFLGGLQNSDNIAATFDSSATPASPPGTYSITPSLSDPNQRLANYTVTTNLGTLTITALNDLFANRKTIPGVSNVFTSSNLTATKETGEPDHAGYPGGHSLWWTWTAPANGTVTIDTIGSTFDTLLAVYSGSTVSNLVALASDDESGGNHTSALTFQANPGAAYQIAVDGFAGATGGITLRLAEVYGPPQFVTQPQSLSISAGSAVALTASVSGSQPFSFQWRKDGVDIPGANNSQNGTNTSLILASALTNQSGSYTVLASNSFGSTLSSVAAVNVFLRPDNDAYANAALLSGQHAQALGNNIFATRDGFESALFAGHSVWWVWTAPTNGSVVVDTLGSSFDTVLGLYTNTTPNQGLVKSDDQSGGNNAARLTFETAAGATYYFGVDGSQWANAAARTGSIVLNLGMQFLPPQITSQPQSLSAELGWNATFTVGASGTGPLTYQWRRNGVDLPGATAPSYAIASVQPGDSGNYSVAIGNAFGAAASAVATLSIYAAPPNDVFANRITITGASNSTSGITVGATKEFGEPNHAGNLGGRSIWWQWVAPTNGTVIMDTIGSTFDTLLAVYTGSSVASLTLLAGDDNSAGNLRSRVVFAATAGTTYQIAVDGSYPSGPNGAAYGNVVLNWQQSALFAPIVLLQPQSQAIAAGGSVSFTVVGAGSPAPTYRWLSNGIPLINKTNLTLQLINVTTNFAASYSVLLSNVAGVVTSSVAVLHVQKALVPGYRGSWPGFQTGDAADVKVDDGLAYVATTAGFLILDVSDPLSPRRIGSYNSDSAATRIVEQAGFVYLLTSSNQISGARLSRFDVRNPGLPHKVAEFVSANANDFALTDDLLCAVDGPALRILDTNCVLVGTLNTANGNARAIVASNATAYVSWANSVQVYSLANPALPAPIATLNQSPAQLALAGGYLYTLTGGQRSVQFRVLDPANLQKPQIGINLQSNTLGQADQQGVAAGAANTAFVVTAGPTGNALGAYAVSQIGNPQLIGTSLFPEGSPRQIAVADDYAYVANGGSGLKIFDVSDPTHPAPVANFFTAVQVNALVLQGNLAFALDRNNGFHVLDVSDPTDPVSLGTYESTNGAAAIAVKSHFVYLALDAPPTTINISGPSLEVVDVADLSQPRRVGGVTLPSPALVALPQPGDPSVQVTALAVSGNLVLVGSYLNGRAALGVIDVSNPASPQVASRYDLPSGTRVARIDFQGRYAYLADTNSGLRVLDLLNPANQVQVGSFPETLPTSSVSVRSNLCLLTGDFGTDLLDVSQPQNPVRTGGNAITGKLDWLQNPLALASGPDSIKVYDLVNASSPLQLGQFVGAYEQVLVQGRYAFAAGGAAGLTILDLGGAFATPPTIIDQPANLRAVAGGSASFFVGVSGNVPVSYQWQFNGADLPGETEPLLRLASVQSTDAGGYGVVVANSSGSVTSSIATLSVNFPPTVALVQPSDHQAFSPPANIILMASAADADGSIARVQFYQGTTALGVISNSPFSLTVSNRPLGSYDFTAVATDNEGAVTTSEVVTAVVTNLPIIQLSAANYLVNESNGVATVTVRRNSSGPASVNFFTLPGAARPAVNGGYGSYLTVSNTVNFPAGVLETNVTIPLINDLVYRGNRAFSVTLANPGAGWTLAYPSNATVTIVDDDPAATTNSFTDVVAPVSAPATLGALQVTLLPAQAVGSWRFTWETEWRSSGDTATGLVPGEHPIEFIPRSGFSTPAVTNFVVNVGFNSLTNSYSTNGVATAGALVVSLAPAEIQSGTNQGQWRLQGEFGTNWFDSGALLQNIPVGFHIAEFKSINGYETPAPRVLSVIAGLTNYGQASYLAALPATGAGPVALPTFATIANGLPAGLPYAFDGQLLTDAGNGSGCVVKKHTVLTAAHVVFDASALAWAGNVRWFFQRHNDEYEPIPQTPRVTIALSGYAAARTNDLLNGLSAGDSSLESRNLDVAVLSFDDSADDTRLPGRGGQGGYLVSDPLATDWLAAPALKLLLGYPVDQIVGADKGKLHQVGPGSFQFDTVTNQVYRSYDLKSYPGNSGGPLCVLATNSAGQPFFLPAAVFLGGSGQTIVRAIDRDVVDLINQSETASAAGGNSTGGGVVHWSGDPTTAPPGFIPGLFRISLLTPSLAATPPGWRIAGAIAWNTDYSGWYYVTNPALNTNLVIEFNDAPGYLKPAAFTTNLLLAPVIPPNQVPAAVIPASYTPIPPAQLIVTPATGLVVIGPSGGPFNPLSATFTLANIGGQNLSWLIGKSSAWLTLSANNGTLAAGASTNITLSVNANATGLASGSYADTLTFINNSAGGLGGTNRPVLLTVVVNAPLLLSGPNPLANGGLRMSLSAASGRVYTIQVSTNLVTWTDLLFLTNTTGTNVFTNTPVNGAAKGFYRAKQ